MENGGQGSSMNEGKFKGMVCTRESNVARKGGKGQGRSD